MCSFSNFIETSKQVKIRLTTSSRGKASWSKNKFGLVSKKVHIFYKFNIIWFLKLYSILSSLNEKLIFALRRRVSNNHTFWSMPVKPGLHKGSHSKGIKWRALHVHQIRRNKGIDRYRTDFSHGFFCTTKLFVKNYTIWLRITVQRSF